jgi:hypothetical protein
MGPVRALAQRVVMVLLFCTMAGSVVPARMVDDSEFDGYNYAYAAVLGSGYYSIEGRRALILRLPLRTILRQEDEETKWGIRIVYPVTLGWYSLKDDDRLLPDDPTNIGTLSVAPGIEFRRRVMKNWLLKPFLIAGPAKEFESGDLAWIAATGIGSRVDFPWERRKIVLRNYLAYAVNFSNSFLPDDDLGVINTKVEYLEKVTENTAIGVIFGNELYFNEVGIRTPEEIFFIRDRWEAGLSYGSYEKFKWWKLPVPRVSLSYRWGQDVSGVRVGFHFDY